MNGRSALSESTAQPSVPVHPMKLARVRLSRGESQKSLARKAGVSASMVAAIEQGRRVPRRLVAEALASALGVDTDTLLHHP